MDRLLSVRPDMIRLALGCIGACGFAPGSVVAEEAKPDAPADTAPTETEDAPPGDTSSAYDEDAEDLEVVITGSRGAEARSRAVVRVDVVTAEEARRRGATNVGEALAGELGMSVNPSAYGSIGNPSAAQINGFDRERVLVLEDGERVVGDVGGAVDLSQLSIGGLSRIEVVRGPSSALYGTSAIGGVINVISGPPELEGWSGSVRLEGRHRWGGFVSADAAYRSEDTWVSASASFYGSEGVSLVAPELALPDTYRIDTTLRAGTKLQNVHEVSIKANFRREAALGLDAQEVPGLGDFLIDLPDVTNQLSFRVNDRLSLGDGHELTLSLAKQWFWNQTQNDRQDSPIDDVRDRFHTMHAAEATGSFFQKELVSFLVGARGEVERFDQVLTRTALQNQEPVTSSLEEVVPTQLGGGSLYSQVRFDPIDWFSGSLGGRIEASPAYGVAAAPKLSVVFLPIKELAIRAGVGRGYRAPTAKEVGFVFDHSSLGYRVIGNPDLVPETSWGGNADVEIRPTKGLQFKVAGYANHVEDLIDYRLAGTSEIAGVDDYTYLNVGEAITSGVEASVAVKAHDYVRAEAGYSYAFSRDLETARPLPGRPPHTLLVSVTADTPIGLGFYGRARMTTDAYLEDDLRTPPFATLDLRVSQKLWAGAQAYAGVLNLMGVQKDVARIGDPRPIEGRTFLVGLSADLPPPAEP